MPNYWGGLIEGFQGRRELELQQNLAKEKENRAMADRVFAHLLQSRDPQMQEMALRGLMTPGGVKAKGFGGFMGGVEDVHSPIYQSMVARMNEMVPDDSAGGAGAPPTQPTPSTGSAAMSTNQMTRPGSAPPQMPTAAPTAPAPDDSDVMSGAPPAAPPDLLGEEGGMGVAAPPPAPPESKWKRRGTGIPLAEEIAEANAQAQLQGRIRAATTALQAAGASPDDIQRAIMGMAGAPQSQHDLSGVNQWGVRLVPDGPVLPVLLDQNGGYKLANGQPLPPGAEMVRMSGAAGGGAGLTSYVEDSPEQRMQLQSQYPGLQLPPGQSPTGYLKLQVRGDGTAMAVPAEFTPPPAYSGTATGYDANGNPAVLGVPRQGVPGNVIAPAVTGQPTAEQSDATALLADVERSIAAAETPRIAGMPKKPLTAQQRDQIARERASAAQLPYTTYFEVQQASKQQRRPSPAPTQPKPVATPGGGGTALSMAEQIRQRALEIQSGKGVSGAGITPPPAEPAVGGVRGRGTGPVR